jgi:CO/xanthine dehydrogenase Mo-binding subunit
MAVYDFPNALTVGYDVVCNRPKVAAHRAPGAPIGSFALESCVDELARELGIDPLRMREINGAKDGAKATHGVTRSNIGYQKTLEAARASEHMKISLKPNQGRGIASGYWHNAGGESSAAVHVNEDGTVTVTEGHPDIGGSRASIAMMVAEVLNIPLEHVRPVVGDTTAIGFSASTGGSRVTFAGGMAVRQAAEKVIAELKKRAALMWEISGRRRVEGRQRGPGRS